jgi:hypothetical protein
MGSNLTKLLKNLVPGGFRSVALSNSEIQSPTLFGVTRISTLLSVHHSSFCIHHLPLRQSPDTTSVGDPGMLGTRDALPCFASASTTWYLSSVVAVACWYFTNAVM